MKPIPESAVKVVLHKHDTGDDWYHWSKFHVLAYTKGDVWGDVLWSGEAFDQDSTSEEMRDVRDEVAKAAGFYGLAVNLNRGYWHWETSRDLSP